ncbi:MAG TPA: hypothetical protein VHC20_05390 [Candidatus Paceibacterota bacterium]|nr:hypothetical protein [Candidatus Paceibacterota bacterium]
MRKAQSRRGELNIFRERLATDTALNQSIAEQRTNRLRIRVWIALATVQFLYDAAFTFANIASYLAGGLGQLFAITPPLAARLTSPLFSFTLLATTAAVKYCTESHIEQRHLTTTTDELEAARLLQAIRRKLWFRLVWVLVLASLIVVGYFFEAQRHQLLRTGNEGVGLSTGELASVLAFGITSAVHAILLFFPARFHSDSSVVIPCAPNKIETEIKNADGEIHETATAIYGVVVASPSEVRSHLVSLLTTEEVAAVNRSMGRTVFEPPTDGSPSPATSPAPTSPPPATLEAPATAPMTTSLEGVL